MSDTITGTLFADRYRITGLLRSGSMGETYVARRTDDERRVSVKVLDPSLFDNPEAVKRFERETRITHTIQHPCSMQVLDSGPSEHGPFLVLEYVEGETLADIIDEQGALPAVRAAHIAARIAMALGAAHAIGVIHRDLAPSNVLIASQGEHHNIVKVTDFGLSLFTQGDDESTDVTAVGIRIGTPDYMAPEYIEEYELDHRADIYGLGVVLYEMLTGAVPFTGRPYKVMDQHVNARATPPSEQISDLPKWLDELVAHMMEKDPHKRPQTAREVVRAIETGLATPVEAVRYIAETGTPAPARVHDAPGPSPKPAPDPIMTHLLERHVLSVELSTARVPPRDRCYVVGRVAKTSPAAVIGVQPGWRAFIVGTGDGLLDVDLLTPVESRKWRFVSPAGDNVAATTTGVPLGAQLMRSPENVVAHYNPLAPVPGALHDLWVQGRWDDLEKLSWRTMLQQHGAMGLLSTGLFAKFLGADKPKLLDHPALLYHGAALVERGRGAEGLRRIAEYSSKYAPHFRAVHDAVATFYLASQRTGDDRRAGLFQSLQRWPLARTATAYEEFAGEPPPTTPWVGGQLNDYSMDAIDRSHSAVLSDVCASIDSSQLLTICMLGGFRGNLDYDDFMHRYTGYTAHLHAFLAGLHVVTTTPEREHDHPEHYVGEDLAQQAGVNLQVLHDYRAFVQRAVKPGSIPTIYLVDKYGTCVHEGPLGPVQLWDALALAGRMRVLRRQDAP